MSSAATPSPLTGHCLCGRVRYRTKAAPEWASYCHCPSCQRATGSVIAVHARWPGEIHLLLGSADHFEGLKPLGHAFCDYQVPWFEVADNLPRHGTLPSQSGT